MIKYDVMIVIKYEKLRSVLNYLEISKCFVIINFQHFQLTFKRKQSLVFSIKLVFISFENNFLMKKLYLHHIHHHQSQFLH